jgi:hypothetical protein
VNYLHLLITIVQTPQVYYLVLSGHGVVPEARASASKSPKCGDYPRPVFLSQPRG